MINHWHLLRNRKVMIREESSNMNNLSLTNLTKEEYSLVQNRWKGVSIFKVLPKYYQMFKTLEHFSPDFVSDDLFMPFILRKLNNKSESEAFVHKGLYDILFKDTIDRPVTLINCINGVCYNSAFEPISNDKVIGLVREENDIIIKPTVGSCMGRNVRKIKGNCQEIDAILSQYGDNYIIQKVVNQSEITAIYNSSSLNTFRISTLNINGKVSLSSLMFRCGQEGAFVDNGGAGGIMIGVDIDGHMREYGYNNKYEKIYNTKGGVIFSEGYFPNMNKIVNKVIDVHKKCLPTMGFAGWDIAIDINNNPIMIEVNLVWPGIQFEQLCQGTPIFGDRTDEVIEFLLSH